MSIRLSLRTALLVAAVTLAANLQAQNAAPLQLHSDVKVDKIVMADGQTKHVLSDPEVVVPGDRLLFRTQYRNTGGQEVTDFVVTNPLPNGVALDPAAKAPAQVSIDGGVSWGGLESLKVVDTATGSQRPAQVGDVTHVRWVLRSVKPGETGEVSFNAIVR